MYAVGIDIGGTHIRCALISDAGAIVRDEKQPHGGKPVPVSAVIEQITAFVQHQPETIVGVGISVAGPTDRDGFVHLALNLGWENVPLAAQVSDALGGMPVQAATDVFCGLMAEHQQTPVPNMTYIAIGTGIGHGILSEGRIVWGACSAANIFGHITVVPDGRRCYCGKRGCLCQYASGAALVELAHERGYDAVRSGDDVVRQAAAGQPDLQRLLDEATKYLALALSHLITLTDTSLIVLGGGAVSALYPNLDDLQAHTQRELYPRVRSFDLRRSELGSHSNLIGAAVLVFNHMQNKGDTHC